MRCVGYAPCIQSARAPVDTICLGPLLFPQSLLALFCLCAQVIETATRAHGEGYKHAKPSMQARRGFDAAQQPQRQQRRAKQQHMEFIDAAA